MCEPREKNSKSECVVHDGNEETDIKRSNKTPNTVPNTLSDTFRALNIRTEIEMKAKANERNRENVENA